MGGGCGWCGVILYVVVVAGVAFVSGDFTDGVAFFLFFFIFFPKFSDRLAVVKTIGKFYRPPNGW